MAASADLPPASVWSVRVDSAAHARAMMVRLGAHPGGVAIMAAKYTARALYVKNLSAVAANILKQEALAAGAEAAVHWGVIDHSVAHSDALLFGTAASLTVLARKLAMQQFGLAAAAAHMAEAVAGWDRPWALELKGREYDLGTPMVVGILNVTPDSFADGGRYLEPGQALARAKAIVEAGAAVVEVGGESTRPGSAYVGEEEELARVMPVVEALAADVPVAVDTRKAAVARRAAAAGAAMINDVTAGRDDPDVAAACAEYGLPLVLMHMRGTPADMQREPRYDDVVGEVREFLAERAAWAERYGVKQIVVDPGIGFGKTLEHNLALLHNVPALADLGFPVMIGHSRKRFIGELTGEEPAGRLAGSLGAALEAARRGAHLLRVHDPKETVQALRVAAAVING